MENIKVLLVEDDLNWQKIFKMLVEDNTKGLFNFTYVDNLTKAVSLAKKEMFDAIVLDLMLPDSPSGENTIITMSSQIENTPIVIVTTLEDERLMAVAFKNGIEDYLVKDKYDDKLFIHICRQAIRRFIAKTNNKINNAFNEIIAHLKSIDITLEKFDKFSC